MPSRRSKDLFIRRKVPSLSRLTYNPIFAQLLSLFDVIPRLAFREFRKLPPNRMRARVGVGNRLFANQAMYLLRGYPLWMYALSRGFVAFDSTIVEIGCGVGRKAHIMRDYRFQGIQFTGKYTGIDVDAEMIDWCRANFDDRFDFVLSSHSSKSYNASNSPVDPYFTIPVDDATVDFVFSTSLLTHLLEPELKNYFAESARILKPGGRMMMSCFALDRRPKRLNDRYTFSHRIGPAYVESMEVPEAAVAYESEWLIAVAKESGFRSAEIMDDAEAVQHMLVAQV